VNINGDVLSLQGYVILTGRAQPFSIDTRSLGG
jgi:hypothetical protein